MTWCECAKCGERHIHAKGMCRRCYNKQYQAQYRITHHAEKLAYQARYRKKYGGKPMSKNRECSSFLGVHVAERVLSEVFKDVQKMPMNHPGYDFICNRGMKIDVKSSTTHTTQRPVDSWSFDINGNAIADYFLCIAFDNRDDLNPLHIWLIPGNAVNDKLTIGISATTIAKWDTYALCIENAARCCDSMKGIII